MKYGNRSESSSAQSFNNVFKIYIARVRCSSALHLTKIKGGRVYPEQVSEPDIERVVETLWDCE